MVYKIKLFTDENLIKNKNKVKTKVAHAAQKFRTIASCRRHLITQQPLCSLSAQCNFVVK
jgi:hypothetical protein